MYDWGGKRRVRSSTPRRYWTISVWGVPSTGVRGNSGKRFSPSGVWLSGARGRVTAFGGGDRYGGLGEVFEWLGLNEKLGVAGAV